MLGVDEFEQDQLYFSERDKCHNRRLHGYGTVLGLHLSLEDGETTDGTSTIKTREVKVTPGIAVNPQGQPICVPGAQCANIDTWLSENQEILEEKFGNPSAPEKAELYIVLCYKECETDVVPVPGKPCRALEDSCVPSRILDDYTLCFSFDKPEGNQEEYMKNFGSLLSQIAIEEGSESPPNWETVESCLNELTKEEPNISTPIKVIREDAPALIRSMYRYWITYVLPVLLNENGDCTMGSTDEKCVLLGTLEFTLTLLENGLYVRDGDVELKEDDRPVLLPSRLLQELFLKTGAELTGVIVVPPTPVKRTRVVAANWKHNGEMPPEKLVLGNERGIAIAFGKEVAGDEGQVLSLTLDENTIQVFAEIPLGSIKGESAMDDAVVPVRLRTKEIRFLSEVVVSETTGLITGGTAQKSATSIAASGVFLPLGDEIIKYLFTASSGGIRITVKLFCDLILDGSEQSMSIAALPAPGFLGEKITCAEDEKTRGGGEFISSFTLIKEESTPAKRKRK